MKIIRLIYIFLVTGSIIYLIDLLFDLFNNDDTQKQVNTVTNYTTGSSTTPSLTQVQLELTANLIDENRTLQQKVESLQIAIENNNEPPSLFNDL